MRQVRRLREGQGHQARGCVAPREAVGIAWSARNQNLLFQVSGSAPGDPSACLLVGAVEWQRQSNTRTHLLTARTRQEKPPTLELN